jgi:lysine-N-methylase
MVAEKLDNIAENIGTLETVYFSLVNELVSGKIKTELGGFNQNYSLKFALISLIQSYFTKKVTARGGAVLNRYFTQLYQQFESAGDTVRQRRSWRTSSPSGAIQAQLPGDQ